jgi:hypothetical protein
MRTGCPSLLLACALLLALARAGAAPNALPDYLSFQLQARGGASVAPAQFNLSAGAIVDNTTVDLSDAGRIAARVRVPTGQPGDDGNRHVFVGVNGSGFNVSEGPVGSSISAPRVAADGKVWFAANLTGGGVLAGIYRYDPGNLTTVRVTGLPNGATSYASARGNAAGQVGYLADFAPVRKWVSFAGGTVEIHAEERSASAPLSDYSLLLPPSFDEERLMAGKVVLFSGGNERIIAKGSRIDDPVLILARTIAEDAGSAFVAFDDEVGMSPTGGRVAFVAELVGGGRGVFRSDAPGSTVEIARTGSHGLTAIEFVAPAVNDDGLVAFRGVDSSGKEAVYVGDDATLRRVIGRGDPIGTDLGPGRIDQDNVNSVALVGGLAINVAGDIAFAAALTPVANSQIEWGTGIFIARAGNQAIHADGFENP